MKPFRLWMLAAILFCGFSCTSCIDDLEDNPVTPEPVVSAHFINEAWMDKTINPGDNFYMYALGSWYTSHASNDQGFWDNNERKNTSTIVNSLFTSDNPLAQHLVRNLKAPRPTLAEDVKDILDYLDIQKPTGIGMLLTEIGKLQDKGLNPIFTKKAYTHPQSHSYAEILTIGTQTRVIELLIVQQRAEEFKRYIKEVLTAIDEATESERMKAEGYEAELEKRTSAVFDEEILIYNTIQASPSEDDSSDSDQPALKGVRSIPDYIEARSIARGLNTRAGDGVRDEISFETLAEAFHLLDNCIVDHSSSSFKT